MTTTLRLTDGSYMRQTDTERIIQLLSSSRCVEVTGISNVGKSSLMRLLAHADVWLQQLGDDGGSFLPVYIDCNRMLEMTEQGFYELVLRCLQESSPLLAQDQELQTAYAALVAPANVFQVPLSFSNALNAALQKTQFKLVLLFDEFDEPFQQIDTRVFLNLRAKKDRFGHRLVYVTATVLPLATLRPGDHSSEFCELFFHQPWHLGPLPRHDVERYIDSFGERNGVILSTEDTDFLYHWTGGHPGYLEGVSRILRQAVASLERGSHSAQDRWMMHRSVAEQLRHEPTLHTESEKIWHSCTPDQQETLRLLFSGLEADDAQLASLMQIHILKQVKDERRAFCRLFAEYVQAHQTDGGAADGLYVDDERGEVFVNGRQIETLTQLEFQLMKLLNENRNKILDKYQIVVGVWGDDHLPEVDDARIEKLISRLRQKVEPDPANPVYITNVRGRGYRLVSD